jgi:hypothetical protein
LAILNKSNIWLLVVILLGLWVAILLMAIISYSIGGYWLLFYLMDIGGYSISGYWCLLIVIILVDIGGY